MPPGRQQHRVPEGFVVPELLRRGQPGAYGGEQSGVERHRGRGPEQSAARGAECPRPILQVTGQERHGLLRGHAHQRFERPVGKVAVPLRDVGQGGSHCGGAAAQQPEERQRLPDGLRVFEDRGGERAGHPVGRAARDLAGGLRRPQGFRACLGPLTPQRRVQQSEHGVAIGVRVTQQELRDHVPQGFVALQVHAGGYQFVGRQQVEHRLVVRCGPGRARVHAGEECSDPELPRPVRTDRPGRQVCRARRVQVGQAAEDLGADQRLGLRGEAGPQHRAHPVRGPGHGRRPDGGPPYVGAPRLHRGQQQGELRGHGPPAGSLVALPLVRPALRYPAEQGQHVRGAETRTGQACQVRDGVCRGLVDRALVQDAPVQLAECFAGLFVVLVHQRAQAVGHIGGAAVGMLVGGPGLGVETGEQGCEIHEPDLGTRY
ncbi:hypothetical protein EES45_05980 [Streptomyces sp. ADI97-07]|uniref:hypothetical protein n=1 Tax=Streptomyces sp. ADI97-07 TaxID=1522762 RepID=UPI000FAEC3AA|nr:hypothetical protein [Streptomyces sp. ADI97-07]RPK83850.1 hypothetical protein EES45_05980 [Streptomyces sp. ADI97-07]